MLVPIYTNLQQKAVQGFTLLETLTSIAILSLVIIGPLSSIINSSSYARQTKDTMIATYLAEESLELLQNQYDSLYVFCSAQAADPFCAPAFVGETPGQIAWRLFKARFGAAGGQPSCFLKRDDDTDDNLDGCSFDFIHMLSAPTSTTPVRYVSTNSACKQIVGIATVLAAGVTRHSYVCSGVPAHVTGTKNEKMFARSVTIEWLRTFEVGGMSSHYNDDLRITVKVQYRGVNGIVSSVKIIRYMHSQQ